ncbi:MAG: hypothetical protein NTY09_08495 [bacterium]|nr:hypothetical protein [bacterium]
MSKSLFISAFLFCLIAIAGCSGAGSNPVTSDPASQDITGDTATGVNDRYLLSYGRLYIDPANMTIEAVPSHNAQFHFNITKIIQECVSGPCFVADIPGMTPEGDFDITFTLTHPVNSSNMTAFDVHGIFIVNGGYNFSEHGLVWSYYGSNNYSIVNADGYSTLWCPDKWPMDQFNQPLFEYFEAQYAVTGYNTTATLNPYKEFYTLPERHAFECGQVVTQHYYLRIPPDPDTEVLNIGYAFDCGYNLPVPLQDPDVPGDFPETANALEAYKIEEDTTGNVTPLGGEFNLDIRIYDWQGAGTIGVVLLEAPELFIGVIEASFVSDDGLYGLYHATVPNELNAPIGRYPILISAEDQIFTAVVGYTVAYNIFYLDVVPPLALQETVDTGGFSVFEGFYNTDDLTCWFSPFPWKNAQKFIGIDSSFFVESGFPLMMETGGTGFCESTQEFYCATSLDDPGWVYDVSVLNITTKALAHNFDLPSEHGFNDTIPLDFKCDEASGNVWFSMYAEDQVGVVSAGTLEPAIMRFDVGDGPTSIYLADSKHMLYVVCELSNTIWGVDTISHNAQELFAMSSNVEEAGQAVVGMAYIPDNDSLYVAGHFSGMVDFYDMNNNAYSGSVIVNEPNTKLIMALKYDPVSGYLFATGQVFAGKGSIYVINPALNELVYSVESSALNPCYMGLDTVNEILYVPDPAGLVDIYKIVN